MFWRSASRYWRRTGVRRTRSRAGIRRGSRQRHRRRRADRRPAMLHRVPRKLQGWKKQCCIVIVIILRPGL